MPALVTSVATHRGASQHLVARESEHTTPQWPRTLCDIIGMVNIDDWLDIDHGNQPPSSTTDGRSRLMNSPQCTVNNWWFLAKHGIVYIKNWMVNLSHWLLNYIKIGWFINLDLPLTTIVAAYHPLAPHEKSSTSTLCWWSHTNIQRKLGSLMKWALLSIAKHVASPWHRGWQELQKPWCLLTSNKCNIHNY